MKSKNARTSILISVIIAILAINAGLVFTNFSFSKATTPITFLEGLKTSATHNITIEIDDTDPTKDWANRSAEGI
ncbi:MAG: hypothetical protein KGD74_07850, partial [Candidatus Lokiarchaeota archaeon]|nr:hypothetical protein [Candidatus Lokiarchaeota archaeon]